MKKKLSQGLMICMIFSIFLSSCGRSGSNKMEVTFDTDDVHEVSSHDYDAHYFETNEGMVCVIDFTEDGHSYEMCISKLSEEFTKDQIYTLIEAFLAKTPAKITGDDLTDAEKFSDFINYSAGDFIYSDDFRSDETWGDNELCWAASASNMLWSSGWAKLAVKNNPDLGFKSVDDVFNYFCENFPNGAGTDSYNGINWFFAGGYLGLYPDKTPGNLLDYDPELYETMVMINEGDSMDDAVDIIKGLKDGGAVGLSVDFSNEYYPLKEDPDSTITYDQYRKEFVEIVYDTVDEDDEDIENGFYVYDDSGDITKVEKKDKDTYVSSDGTEYDLFNVLTGDLYLTKTGSYAVVDDGFYFYPVIRDLEDIDFDNVEESINLGVGAHALTVSGYVIDKDEQIPEESVKALFITDSDNDALCYNMPKETRDNELSSRASRPNTIKLFMTSPIKAGGSDDSDGFTTLDIEGYIDRSHTPIAAYTGLKAAP